MKITIRNENWRARLARPDEHYDENAAKARLGSLADIAREFGFDERDLADLKRETDIIGADAELLRFWDRVRQIINGAGGFRLCCEDMRAAGGENFHPYAFYLTETLAGVPEMRKLYAAKGWPEDMIALGLRDFKIWMEHTRENYGLFGLSMTAYPWLQASITGAVMRPGRLQCNTKAEFPARYRVYRNRRDGRTVVFYTVEQDCCAAGFPALPGEETAFRTAALEETTETVRGHLCGADGRIEREKTALGKSEWEVFLKGGDPVINLHIPADGPLDTDSCRAAMARMKTLFHDKMGVDAKAFTCESWLLDPQFPDFLPENSNLVRFQKLGRVLPYPGCPDTVMRVFGVAAAKNGIDTGARRTNLQRNLAAFFHAGGRFRNGFFYITA